LHAFKQGVNRFKWRRNLLRVRKEVFCALTLAPALCLVAGAGALVLAQNPAPPAQNTPAEPLDPSRIIPFLDQTLTWYRQMTVDQQIANDPSEVTIVSNNRALIEQIVRLSFDFARAEADILESNSASSQTQAQNKGMPEEQAIRKAEAHIDQEIKDSEAEASSLKQKLATATGKQRQFLQSQIAQSQAEAEMEKVRKDAIHSMLEFVTGAGGGTGNLKAQIDALAASVGATPSTPAATSSTREQTNANGTNIEAAASQPTGIWDLGEELFGISRKLQTINNAIEQTQILAKSSRDLRAPLNDRLGTLARQGDQLANQPPPKNAADLAQERQEVNALTTGYKQLVAIAIPLGKQGILFELYQKSLESWHDEVRGDLGTEVGRLGVRLAVLALFIGIVVVLSEIGKRAIYRYVQEPHRRYQFLLLRKIGLALAIIIIVALGFASRLESAVTYAGLLTAGIAVALQNVIVSVVGYFFLIGRYGIRVGDRVQISGVTGEVVDIGLVRIHVMELGGSSADTPTGRVVAFSNSIVFQPAAGIFKQIPGTNFVWHEATVTLAPNSDFRLARERLLGAVQSVLADYHEEMDRQNRAIERNLIAVPSDGLRPQIHLRLTPSGLETLIRFPVDLRHAGEIDERVTRELLKAVDQEPKLNLAGSAPAVSLRTDAAGAHA
jgi:small-conductance mechanosensitive channel